MSNRYICPLFTRELNTGLGVYVVAPDEQDARRLLQCKRCSIREGKASPHALNTCKGPVDYGPVETVRNG